MPKRNPNDSVGLEDDQKSSISQEAMASTQAIINFIDLAGSERASVHEGMAKKTSVPIGATVRNPSPFGSTARSNSNNKPAMNSGPHQRSSQN